MILGVVASNSGAGGGGSEPVWLPEGATVYASFPSASRHFYGDEAEATLTNLVSGVVLGDLTADGLPMPEAGLLMPLAAGSLLDALGGTTPFTAVFKWIADAGPYGVTPHILDAHNLEYFDDSTTGYDGYFDPEGMAQDSVVISDLEGDYTGAGAGEVINVPGANAIAFSRKAGGTIVTSVNGEAQVTAAAETVLTSLPFVTLGHTRYTGFTRTDPLCGTFTEIIVYPLQADAALPGLSA
jgi:hypothetical protein